jgi:hypothetical protein
MRYSLSIFFVALICFSAFQVHAELSESQAIQKAYSCIESKISNRSLNSIALQEATFAALASNSNANVLARIDADKNTINNQTCWPKAGCTVKDTAQVLLAYRELGNPTTPLENYLLSKSASAGGLKWFLIIDIQNQQSATCTLRYSSQTRTITVGSDMKLSGDAGTCLTLASEGYWLEVAPSCLDRSFEISCSEDFITALHYEKSASDETLYISPTTHSAIASGTTNESIQSKCFKQGTECDYEGTLWASLALQTTGRDVSSYTPYLRALALDNRKYFPEAFLLKLTDNQEDFSAIIQSQIQEKYWQAPSTSYNKIYDTALALLALQGRSAETTLTNAKTYLLTAQGSNGCWGDNLRDTAFVLYAGWPRESSGGTNGGSVSSLCEQASLPHSCVNAYSTCLSGGGTILSEYNCPGAMYCCSQAPAQQTCTELNGLLCSTSETCLGSVLESAEGGCCLGSCVPREEPTTDACTISGGYCTSSCDSDTEEPTTDACTDVGQVCCVPATKSSGSSTWIIILSLLIALVILGIIFRKKIQLWMYKVRAPKGSTSPVIVRRPPLPPSPPLRRQEMPPLRQVSTHNRVAKDKELEETLKKLKEMSR